jgi:very-short-patch-repair endonuclease
MPDVRIIERSHRIRRARELRAGDTGAEAKLWRVLRARRLGGWRWKRQVPWGPFFLDFLCVEAGLVVEVDGCQHAEQAAYDARRTSYIERSGLRVIRFMNGDVITNLPGVCLTILAACGGEHPPLSDGPPPLPLCSEAERRGRG